MIWERIVFAYILSSCLLKLILLYNIRQALSMVFCRGLAQRVRMTKDKG